MANYAVLIGCPSKKATQEDWGQFWRDEGSDNKGWGPIWRSKYCIAGFWLACFSPEDAVHINRSDEDGYPPEFTALYVSADIAVNRLKNRKALFLQAIPRALQTAYAVLYDNWVKAVESEFKTGLLLDCDDLFSMMGHEEGSEGLQGLVTYITRLENGESSLNLDELGFTGFINLGEVSPYEASRQSPENIALNWQAMAVGLPDHELSRWPPKLTSEEISFAQEVSSKVQADNPMKPVIARKPKKPRKTIWKLW